MYTGLGSMSVTSSCQLETYVSTLSSVNVIWLRGDDIRRVKCDIHAV